jgi:sulfur carrier protein
MILTVAGEKKEYPQGLTVAALVAAEGVENPEYVTVSVNDRLVDGGDFPKVSLSDGDSVEFLYFMGGGSL